VVDASQGIEAQTLANCYLALENDLEIVACSTRSTCPRPIPDGYAAEIEQVLGIPADQMLRISAKTGEGVGEPCSTRSSSASRPRWATPRRRCRR
jgi:GTP-binding protein LepA